MLTMRVVAMAMLVFLAIATNGQTGSPDANAKPILQNSRVTAALVDLPASANIARARHGDMLTVIVGGNAKSKFAPGTVLFVPAGQDDPNLSTTQPVREVRVEFADPQGRMQPEKPRSSRYCNPGSKTACVDEKYLFCTAKVCVEDVTMGPGAVSTRHSHDTDHMLVAITDYSLSDDVEHKGVVMRNVQSGGVEYIPAGITHTLTNKTGKQIRFVVVVFR